MRLEFEPCGDRYVSPSQRARVLTEQWVETWAYCPNCGHLRLERYPNNRPVADFFCTSCREDYELKSQKSAFGARIADGDYKAMCRRLACSQNPNLMLLNYSPLAGVVTDFCIVPKYFFALNLI
jgi:type II restriction enzyme